MLIYFVGMPAAKTNSGTVGSELGDSVADDKVGYYYVVGGCYKGAVMQFESFSFGSIQIDGVTYEHDVVIDRGEVRKRKKGPSRHFRSAFGHTPLSIKEKIPWKCDRLVIGTGTGVLPVMEEVKREARRRKIKLFIAPTARAIELLKHEPACTNAVLHITC